MPSRPSMGWFRSFARAKDQASSLLDGLLKDYPTPCSHDLLWQSKHGYTLLHLPTLCRASPLKLKIADWKRVTEWSEARAVGQPKMRCETFRVHSRNNARCPGSQRSQLCLIGELQRPFLNIPYPLPEMRFVDNPMDRNEDSLRQVCQ